MPLTWAQSYARSLLIQTLSKISEGRLDLVLKDVEPAEVLRLGRPGQEAPIPTVVVRDPDVWTRIAADISLGVSESYFAQELECDNLVALCNLYIANSDILGSGSSCFDLVPSFIKALFRPTNDRARSLANAAFHYNTSNGLFNAFLSPDMNYSCALWSGNPEESLESAQVRKVDDILDRAQLSSTDRVLDIGCGWGFLAMQAVRRFGCSVTGITLSLEQKDLAKQRIRAAGLQDKIEIILCDYRAVTAPPGGFDRIISVEMLEHVGREYMDMYFTTISKLLKPKGGRIVVQSTTVAGTHHGDLPTFNSYIQKYVFPGGFLPSINFLLSSVHNGSKGTLEVEYTENIGPHYIRTLRLWRENFNRNWEAIRADFIQKHGSPSEAEIEAYKRQWIYFFCYSESGFRANLLRNYIVVASRANEPDLLPNVPL